MDDLIIQKLCFCYLWGMDTVWLVSLHKLVGECFKTWLVEYRCCFVYSKCLQIRENWKKDMEDTKTIQQKLESVYLCTICMHEQQKHKNVYSYCWWNIHMCIFYIYLNYSYIYSLFLPHVMWRNIGMYNPFKVILEWDYICLHAINMTSIWSAIKFIMYSNIL